MDRRQQTRRKRRLTCEIVAEKRQFRGIVLDLSPNGLFVQTSATIEPGAPIRVRFPALGRNPAFEVEARVARRRRVPQRLAALAAGGLGLHVPDPPPAFERLGSREDWADVAEADDGAEKETEAPALPRFRARLAQVGGPRSRSLVIQATDLDQARSAATRQAGMGWQLIEIEEV